MPNQIFSHSLARIATCTAILGSAILDAQAANELLKYPDLSGQWGRDMLFFEPPPSGPGPVSAAERKADGTVVVLIPCCFPSTGWWLGDHTSPILKPEARGCRSRQEVRRLGAQGRGDTGLAQHVLARAPALCSGDAFSPCRFCSRGTRLYC